MNHLDRVSADLNGIAIVQREISHHTVGGRHLCIIGVQPGRRAQGSPHRV
jgi:hypothetical protein